MKNIVEIFKALSETNRLRIVMVLIDQEELCSCQITQLLGLTASTVSTHTKILKDAELIESRKVGRWVYFNIADTFPENLKNWLLETVSDSKELKKDQKSILTILDCLPHDRCKSGL